MPSSERPTGTPVRRRRHEKARRIRPPGRPKGEYRSAQHEGTPMSSPTASRAPLVRGYEVVIGIETHAQLSTASKIFSGSSTAFGAAPNTHASAVDLALP